MDLSRRLGALDKLEGERRCHVDGQAHSHAQLEHSAMMSLARSLKSINLSYLDESFRSIVRLPIQTIPGRSIAQHWLRGGRCARKVPSNSFLWRIGHLWAYAQCACARRSTTCPMAGTFQDGQRAHDRIWCGPVLRRPAGRIRCIGVNRPRRYAPGPREPHCHGSHLRSGRRM